MTMLQHSVIESGGYNIDRSLRFRSSASAYLSRTPASASNRSTWTWSGWIKRGVLGTTTGMAYQQLFGACPASGSDATFTELVLNGNDTLQVGGWTTTWKVTTQVFRDTSAWYHFVWVLDTGNATAADRMRLYVNGSRITSFSTSNDPSLNATLGVNNNVAHALGSEQPYSSRYFDGYLAEVNFIDGQALTPSSFGQTDAVTGVWTPKKYTGTYGTNGFYLPFSDNTSATTLAYDKSGNGNNWTPNNISTTSGATYDSMTDVPTLTSATAANFCTLNPVFNATAISASATTVSTISNGNLTAACSNTTTGSNAYGTIGVTSGKWYFELTRTSGGANTDGVGFFRNAVNTELIYRDDGNFRYNNSELAYGASWQTNGTVIGVALDLDNTTITFYKNGVSQGAATTSLPAGTYIPYVYNRLTGTLDVNFGQRPFSYTPPTGFKALNTFNLPDPTIKKPNQYMDATLYTGNGTSQSVVNAAGFQPDFVWIKLRNQAGDYHNLFDSSRGVYNRLFSNDTGAENTNNQTLTAFNSNGFSVGSNGNVNTNAINVVGWQWKESATAGFDIVTFTSPASGNFTVNHSLGVTPAMVIVKTRDTAGWNWHVWHKSLASATNSVLVLNSTAAVNSSFNMWGAAGATSTTIGITTGNPVPANSACVAYLFAEIPGFSKFGSYTGNGSADGPFVYCGFRPKYVLVKDTTNAGTNWMVLDTSRDPYNVEQNYLSPNTSSTEGAATAWDGLSNGFKLRGAGTPWNGSGATMIFAAFAENPFKYANAR